VRNEHLPKDTVHKKPTSNRVQRKTKNEI